MSAPSFNSAASYQDTIYTLSPSQYEKLKSLIIENGLLEMKRLHKRFSNLRTDLDETKTLVEAELENVTNKLIESQSECDDLKLIIKRLRKLPSEPVPEKSTSLPCLACGSLQVSIDGW